MRELASRTVARTEAPVVGSVGIGLDSVPSIVVDPDQPSRCVVLVLEEAVSMRCVSLVPSIIVSEARSGYAVRSTVVGQRFETIARDKFLVGQGRHTVAVPVVAVLL